MKDLHLFALSVPSNNQDMAWTLRWPLWQRHPGGTRRKAANRLTLSVGSGAETRHVDLSCKDVWQLRNGFMILRDGLLVVPESGKLRFLLAEPSHQVERKVIGELEASVLTVS